MPKTERSGRLGWGRGGRDGVRGGEAMPDDLVRALAVGAAKYFTRKGLAAAIERLR